MMFLDMSLDSLDHGESSRFELVDFGDIGNYQTELPPSKRGLLAVRPPKVDDGST